jgi:hypothetical protein
MAFGGRVVGSDQRLYRRCRPFPEWRIGVRR